MKKIICIMLSFLLSASLMGCGSSTEGETTFTNEETLQQSDEQYYNENTEETKTPTLPTYDEAFEYIKNRYYDESSWTALSQNTFTGPNNAVITATEGCVLYKKGGLMNAIYFDSGFSSFVVSNSNITSTWSDISAFYEDYLGVDLELTAEELVNEMQLKYSLSSSEIYTYEYNGFSFSVQKSQSGVTITVKPL